MVSGQLKRVSMTNVSANLRAWERRVAEMRQCKRVSDLVARYGEPHHKDPQPGVEIWHYPLGVASRWLYSVHVAVSLDQSCQVFMFFEPTELADSPPERRWWQFWKVYCLTLSLLCFPVLLHSAPEPSRPNLLFILADDLRWDAVGFM